MKTPNFLLLGAQKAGTTSIVASLHTHPQIFLSPIKEPHYFCFDPRWDKAQSQRVAANIRVRVATNLESYLSLFNGSSGFIASGEASTSYLSDAGAPSRIKAFNPEMKMIAILRNPVDRAISAYTHLLRDHVPGVRSLEEELANESTARPVLFRLRSNGLYYKHLSAYWAVFPREQLRVFLFEDLLQDFQGVMRLIFDFLGVDPQSGSVAPIWGNASGKAKNQMVANALSVFTPTFQRKVGRWLPRPVRRAGRSALRSLRVWNRAEYEIEPSTRDHLLSLFIDDISKLQSEIGRDLSKWLLPVSKPTVSRSKTIGLDETASVR